MRWDSLFADLVGQLEAGLGAEQAELVAELTRAERAGVALADRFRAHRGPLRLTLVNGESLAGEVTDAGPEWFLLTDGPREHLVVLAAVASAGGLTERVALPDREGRAGLGITTALRALARDRQIVRIAARGAELIGMVAAVGADHLDLSIVSGDTRRPTGERVTVPLPSLIRVTRG